MKMSDAFKLPMVCEDGDGFIYSKDLRHSIQFDDSDTHMMDHKKAVTHAINNHDRMIDEIAELRDALLIARNGYKNLIELGALPNNGWNGQAKDLIGMCDKALAKHK
jgi:hypothetical protein